jgi:hypothetical protein
METFIYCNLIPNLGRVHTVQFLHIATWLLYLTGKRIQLSCSHFNLTDPGSYLDVSLKLHLILIFKLFPIWKVINSANLKLLFYPLFYLGLSFQVVSQQQRPMEPFNRSLITIQKCGDSVILLFKFQLIDRFGFPVQSSKCHFYKWFTSMSFVTTIEFTKKYIF